MRAWVGLLWKEEHSGQRQRQRQRLDLVSEESQKKEHRIGRAEEQNRGEEVREKG